MVSSSYHKRDHREAGALGVYGQHFKWLPRNNWSPELLLFYEGQRCKDFSLLPKQVSYLSSKSREKINSALLWILCSLDNQPLLWSQAQVTESAYRNIEIHFGQQPESKPVWLCEACSLFVSDRLLSSNADTVVLTAENSSWTQDFERYFQGLDTKEIWIPSPGYPLSKNHTWMVRKIISFPAYQWWESSSHRTHKNLLAHVTKRRLRKERSQ